MPERKENGGKVLLVDVGNTSLKWAWLGGQGKGVNQTFPYVKLGIQQAAKVQWSRLERPGKVYISSVAAADTNTALYDWVAELWRIEPIFIKASAAALGVINAYQKPEQLGVDRWLALIAAHSEMPDRDCLVVDCGTAVTIDGLTREGEHLGGIILPGFGLMRDALRRQTAIPWPDMAHEAPPLFATNTGEAITGGGLHAVAALVEKMARQLQDRTSESPIVVLAGSDAEYLQKLLSSTAVLRPDLVMQGLALLAQDSSN